MQGQFSHSRNAHDTLRARFTTRHFECERPPAPALPEHYLSFGDLVKTGQNLL